MTYRVSILRRALKELEQLPPEHYPRIRNAIRHLASDPRPAGCLKLTGRAGWRIRVGVYRVIYDIDDGEQSVTVLNVGHRRDIY